MSGACGLQLSGAQKERVLAVLAAVFAVSLITAARAIEDSLLSDAVGAGGVPQGVGGVMLVAALALFGSSFRGQVIASVNTSHDSVDEGSPTPWSVATRTAGLVIVLIGFGLLLPYLGYAITVSLLVLAVGWLAGAALRAPLLLCAAGTGPFLWALFDKALQVRMPVGSLWQ